MTSQFTRRNFIWLEESFSEILNRLEFATDREMIWFAIRYFAKKISDENSHFDPNLFVSEIKRLQSILESDHLS